MKSLLKNTLLVSLAAIGLTVLAQANANDVMSQPKKQAKQTLEYSGFMPSLMNIAIQNKALLHLSKLQVAQLKTFHAANSAIQEVDVTQIDEMEKQAAAAALEGNVTQAQVLGQKSIYLRQILFNQTLRCHLAMQQFLTMHQYRQLLNLAKQAK